MTPTEWTIIIVYSMAILLQKFQRKIQKPEGYRAVSRHGNQTIYADDCNIVSARADLITKSLLFKVKLFAIYLFPKRNRRFDWIPFIENMLRLKLKPEKPFSVFGYASYDIETNLQFIGLELPLVNIPVIRDSAISHELFHIAQEVRSGLMSKENELPTAKTIRSAFARGSLFFFAEFTACFAGGPLITCLLLAPILAIPTKYISQLIS